MQVSSRPVTVSCSAKGGEKEMRVKLSIGRKAEASPVERLVEKQKIWCKSEKTTSEKRRH